MSQVIDLGVRLTGEDDDYTSVLERADQATTQLGQSMDTLRAKGAALGDGAKAIAEGYDTAKSTLESFGVGVEAIESAIKDSALAQDLFNAATEAGSSFLAALGVEANGYSEILDGTQALQEEFGNALTDGAKGAADYGLQLASMAQSVRFTGIAAEFSSGMVGKLKLAFLGLFAVFAAINIAKTIYEESEAVQLIVNRLVQFFRTGWSYIEEATEKLAAFIETKFRSIPAIIYPLYAEMAERIGAVLANIPGLESAGARITAFADEIRKRLEDRRSFEERALDIASLFEARRTLIAQEGERAREGIREAFAARRVASESSTEAAAALLGNKTGAGLLGELQQLLNQVAAARAQSFSAMAEADAAIMRDGLSRQQQDLQRALQLQLIDQRDYITQSAALREAAAQAELDAVRARAEQAAQLSRQLEDSLAGAQARGDDKEVLKIRQQIYQLDAQREALRAREVVANRTLLDIDKQRVFEFEKLDRAAQQQLLAFETYAAEQQRDLDLRLRQLDQEAQLRGKTSVEIRVATELSRLDIEYQRQRLQLLAQIAEVSKRYAEGEEPVEVINRMLAKLAEFDANWAALRDKTRQGIIDQAAYDKTKEFGDGLSNAITDAIAQGKSVSDSFLAYLKQSFNNLVLRPAINFAVQGGVNAIGSLLGLGGGGAAGGGGGFNLGSLLGLGGGGGFGASALNTIGSFIAGGAETGFLAGFGSFVSNIGSLGFTGAISSAFSTAFANFAAGGLSGIMTGLGSLLGPVGIIVGLLASFGVFKNEKGFKFDNAGTGGGSDGRGGGRSQLIDSPFGVWDFAGDFKNEMVQPFIDTVGKLDKAVVDRFFKRPEELDAARTRVQSIKDQGWFGANDKAETEASLKGATLRFLKERYGTIFESVDAQIAASIANFTGSTDELVQYIAKVIDLSNAFDMVIAEVPQLELTLSAFVNASDEARNTLATLGATLKLTSLDFEAEVQKVIDAASRTPAQALTAQTVKVLELAQAFDGTLAKAQELAQAEATRLQMLQGLLLQIAQISSEIGAMFKQSAADFRLATMDASEQYAFFDQGAAAAFAELQTATDPQRIRELSAQYNQYLRSAFGLLDEQQKKDSGEQFAKLAEDADALAQARLAAAKEAAIAEAKAFGQEIKIAIVQGMEKVAADMQKAADKLDTAADKIDQASRRPIVVTGYIETPDGNRTPIDAQAGVI